MKEEGIGERIGRQTSQFSRCHSPERKLTSQPLSCNLCPQRAPRSFTPWSCSTSTYHIVNLCRHCRFRQAATHSHSAASPHPKCMCSPTHTVQRTCRCSWCPCNSTRLPMHQPVRTPAPMPHTCTQPQPYTPANPNVPPTNPKHSLIPICTPQRSLAPMPTTAMSEDPVPLPAAHNSCQHHHEDHQCAALV